MPRKVRWTVLGIWGLSVLMGGGSSAEAQSEGTGTQRAAEAGAPGRQAGGQGLPEGAASDLWGSLAELRAEVSQLRQEVTRLRAQVAETGVGGSGRGDARADTARSGTGPAGNAGAQAGQGTGGSGASGGGTAQGTGGSDTAQGTGGAGAAGTGTQAPLGSDVPPAGSEVPSPRGTAVVNAIYTGVVYSASEQQVVIDMEGGGPLALGVDRGTRVFREGRSIGAPQLEKGEQVRAVVNLVGQDKTLEIAVLPTAAPKG